jgi:hypothetical protein
MDQIEEFEDQLNHHYLQNEELIRFFINEGNINIINSETGDYKLKIINNKLRSKIRHLSSLAETEIEPNISSEIINEVIKEGISFGICPGGT